MTESKVDAYVRASDEATEYANAQAEELEQRALEDIDELLFNVEERDPDLWAYFEVEAEDTLDEFEAVEDEERDLDWAIGVGAISSASLTQFVLDHGDELIIRPVAYVEQSLAPYDLSRKELVAAGKRGTVGLEVARPDAFQKIRAKYLDDLSFISRLDPVDLYRTLLDAKALPSIEAMTADAMGYVSRMTGYKPGSTQWKQAVADLVNRNSKSVMRDMSRRAIERIHTVREIERSGEPDPLMMWLGEGGNPCMFCIDRFGIIQRFSAWVLDGLPGPSVCQGGNRCKCRLVAA